MSNPQKALLCACPKMLHVGVTKNRRKDRNFHASNWLFAQTTHVDIAPEICMRCRVQEVVIVSWKSVQGSPSCGGSKIALSYWIGPWLILQLVLPSIIWFVSIRLQ